MGVVTKYEYKDGERYKVRYRLDGKVVQDGKKEVRLKDTTYSEEIRIFKAMKSRPWILDENGIPEVESKVVDGVDISY